MGIPILCALSQFYELLNVLAIDEPLEYARLHLDGNLQMWVDAEDSLNNKPPGNQAMCFREIYYQISYFLQFLTISLNHMLVPVETLFLITLHGSAAIIVAVHINKSVAFTKLCG